ncbi:MAG: hypothetical protein CME64_15010 [Halobacteriovoraceae bacterium]|nr:hypothetical protein [Halobacteriovoraceae bacterium]
MGYQVLARKWRPKTFNEGIGQDHIARTLQNSILKEKVAHAYLFTGTRGVGKTTIARIFAKAIRCQNLDEKGNPCLECGSCKSIDQSNALDYVEIDGASNNSVDNVRELIENAQYLPTNGKYKVYVVDEVHMLSTSAFNALLKTLEEPPEHVIFIFATTDPHKLLGTVLSRCQRFDFKHVGDETLISHIKKIAELENIEFESEESVRILARQGNGSVRDTLSLMDQALSLSAQETISEQTLLQSLGLARADSIKELASSIIFKNPAEALKVFDEITLDSVELGKLSNQILDKVFDVIENIDDSNALSQILTDAVDIDTAEIMWVYEVLLKDFEWALDSLDPLRAMRFSLLKVCKRDEIVGRTETPVKKKVSSPVEADRSEVTSNQGEAPEKEEPKAEEAPVDIKSAARSMAESLDKPANKSDEPQPNPVKEQPEAPKRHVQAGPKNWQNFLKHLIATNRSLALNLERARLLGEVNENSTEINLAFTEGDKIFFDVLNEPEKMKKLNNELSLFFTGEEAGGPKVVYSIIDEETKERENLYSNVEIEERKIQASKEEKEAKIRSNKFIKEAQELFNGELSKVIINKDE